MGTLDPDCDAADRPSSGHASVISVVYRRLAADLSAHLDVPVVELLDGLDSHP
jgi:hypothetical protein